MTSNKHAHKPLIMYRCNVTYCKYYNNHKHIFVHLSSDTLSISVAVIYQQFTVLPFFQDFLIFPGDQSHQELHLYPGLGGENEATQK